MEIGQSIIWIDCEEQGEDVEVKVIAKSGETRIYQTYAEYRKEFRFSYPAESDTKIMKSTLKRLSLACGILAKMAQRLNLTERLTTVFTYKKWGR